MKKLLMLPLWIVQIFGQAKSFSRNPVLGSVWLNRLGLHAGRLILAHYIMHARMLMLSRGIPRQQRREFFANGFLVIPDFFPAATLAALQQEIASANAEVRECIQGDTLTHRIVLDNATRDTMPACHAALADPKMQRLLKFCAGKNGRPISYIQTIKNHFVNGPADPQKNLHSDTFHPTMKSWYFIDDVDEKNGPFTYVPGSNRLTLARLRWEYRRSIEISGDGDRYSGNGSFRLSAADAESMQLAAPRSFKVAANTLVIANTHGFHCRGQASERSTRTELWTISRSNPFNPFPGLGLPLVAQLENRALAAWRRYCDHRAAQAGRQSSWHLIEARNTLTDTDSASAAGDQAELQNRKAA